MDTVQALATAGLGRSRTARWRAPAFLPHRFATRLGFAVYILADGSMPLNHVDAARHRAYVLRCWEVGNGRPGRPAKWRFSLECVETKEKRYLPDLEGLMAFLREELAKGSHMSGDAAAE